MRRPSATALVASGTGLTLIVTGLLGLFAYTHYQAAESAQDENSQHGARMRLLGDAETALFSELGALIGAAALNQPERFVRLSESRDRLNADVQQLSGMVPQDDPLGPAVGDIRAAMSGTDPIVDRTIEIVRSEGMGPAISYSLESDLAGKMTSLLATMEQTIGAEGGLLVSTQDAAESARQDMLHALMGIGAAALVMILVTAAGVRQLLTRPLQQVNAAARAMASGDNDRRAPVHGVRELASVAEAVNTLRDELTRRSREVEAYLSRNLEARTQELEATNRDLVREMSERERAETAGRSSELHLRMAMEAASVGTWEWDFTSGAVGWPEGLQPVFGLPPAGFNPAITGWAEMVHPDDRQEIARVILKALQSRGGRFQVESRVSKPGDTGPRWLRVAGEVQFDAENRPVRAYGTAIDVTAERERNDALARSEEGLRAAQRLTGLGSFDWDIRGDNIVWSEGMFDLLALSAADVHPSYALFMSCVHRDDVEAYEARIAEAFAGEPNPSVDCRVVRPDGEIRFVRAVAHVDFSDGGEPARMIATFLDVTESRQAEDLLRQQRELVSAVVASAPIVLYATDQNGTFTVSQGLGLTKLGLQQGEAVGQSVWDLYRDYPPIIEATKRALAGESHSYVADFGDTLFEVAEVPLMEDGQVQGMVGVAVDTSERAKLQGQLLQAQKMESVGRLAGGVAHDFNNLLSAIIGYSELAASALEPGSQPREDIQEAILAANKAATLTRQLLSFARRQMVEPEDVDVNEVVTNLEKLLRRLIGEDVQFTCKTAVDALVARVDPGQFEQVLVNLAVNARDAMPDGGKLIIETSQGVLDAAYAAARADVQPGSYIVVAVSDTGTGMAPSVLEHIFEPFYTTKEQGKGTGLGLATCYGIVKQAGGHISVYSEVGFGTTFKVYLPQVGTAAAATRERPHAAPYQRGSERILLVEDQAEVRLLTERVLTSHGYTVIAAANPMKALELASGDEHIDLVISDVVMPGMDGVTMVDVLLRMLGPLPVILMSGYAEESVISRAMGRPGVEFVAKPLSPESLLTKTRDVLSAWRTAHSRPSDGDGRELAE